MGGGGGGEVGRNWYGYFLKTAHYTHILLLVRLSFVNIQYCSHRVVFN